MYIVFNFDLSYTGLLMSRKWVETYSRR